MSSSPRPRFASTFRFAAYLLLILLVPTVSQAQTPYTQDPDTYLNAQDFRHVFWLYIGDSQLTNDKLFAAAAAAHVTGVRIPCSWPDIEIQSAPPGNTSTGYHLSTKCAAAVASAIKYHLQLMVVIQYYPPNRPEAYATLAAPVAVGDTSAQIQLVQGVNGFDFSGLRTDGTMSLGDCTLDDFSNAGSDPVCQGAFQIQYVKYVFGAVINGIMPIDATHATVQLSMAAKSAIPVDPVHSATCSTTIDATTHEGTQLVCPAGTFLSSQVGKARVVMSNSGAGCSVGSSIESGISAVSADGSTATVIKSYRCATSAMPITINRILLINERLYPAPVSELATDPGNVGLANVTQWLANYIGSQTYSDGTPVKVKVEMLNEPGQYSGFRLWFNANGSYDYGFGGEWNSTTTYRQTGTSNAILPAVVTRNGTYYFSLTTNNLNHDPLTDTTNWSSTIPSNAYKGPIGVFEQNWGFVGAAQNLPAISTNAAILQPYTWNTASTLLNPAYMIPSGVTWAPGGNVKGEVFHPYQGKTGVPEGQSTLKSVLDNYIASNGTNGSAVHAPGNWKDPSIVYVYYLNEKAKLQDPNSGEDIVLSETGTVPVPNALEDQDEKVTSWDIRHALSFAGIGIKTVSFYQINDGETNVTSHQIGKFGWVSTDSSGNVTSTFKNYVAMKSLMEDVDPISTAPVAYTPSSLASVTSASGLTFPLAPFHIVGRGPTDTDNSDYFVLYQRSYVPEFLGSASGTTLTVSQVLPAPGTINDGPLSLTAPLLLNSQLSGGFDQIAHSQNLVSQLSGTPGGAGNYQMSSAATFSVTNANAPITMSWMAQPQPAAGTVVIAVPAGKRFVSATNLVTRAAANCSQSGSSVTCTDVGEDPEGVMFAPNVLQPSGLHIPGAHGLAGFHY